jgi:hypothetical protein
MSDLTDMTEMKDDKTEEVKELPWALILPLGSGVSIANQAIGGKERLGTVLRSSGARPSLAG